MQTRVVVGVDLIVGELGSATRRHGANTLDRSSNQAIEAFIGFGVSACLMAAFKAYVLWFPKERWPLVNGFQMAAGGLACSTSQLVKFLKVEPRALESVNRARVAAGMDRLR